MLIQNTNMPFELPIAIAMFILWGFLIILSIFLLLKKKINKNLGTILYICSLIVGGIILGGIPNAVMPIQFVLFNLSKANPIITIIPMIIILVLLLISTIIIGRAFCGYACPIGALQELISKISFKSSLKEQKKVKIALKIEKKVTNMVRYIFLALIIMLTLIWNLAVLQILNPFTGLSFFRSPGAIALLIPLITLIVVAIASIFVYRPWCRFLCPFGALASLISRLSRYKLNRTDACTECGICEKICPTQEAFKDSKKGECYLCNRCVDACPQNAIEFLHRKKA